MHPDGRTTYVGRHSAAAHQGCRLNRSTLLLIPTASCYIAHIPSCLEKVKKLMSEPLLETNPEAGPVRLVARRMSPPRRWVLVGLAAALASVFGVAGWLRPDERGYGTHEQLGLPPCAFRAITGIPCPSCGMTTSFAYVVRGQLSRAAWANPGGCLLAIGTVGLIPWCLISAMVGRPLGLRSLDRAAIAAVLLVFGISLLGWMVRFLFFEGQR